MKQLLTVSLLLLSCYCIAHIGKGKTVRLKYPKGMKYVPSGAFKMKGDNNGTDERTLQMVGFFNAIFPIASGAVFPFADVIR